MTSRTIATAATVCAALLAFAAPADAQRKGRGPVITAVQDGNGQVVSIAPQGGVLVLIGSGFHACPPKPKDVQLDKWRCPTHDAVKVSVAGKNAFVVDSRADAVTFIIPQATRPGKGVRIEVKHNGTAKTSIEVMTKDEFSKTKISRKEQASEAGGASGVRLDEETRILQSFKITKFEHVQNNAGNTFLVEGVAEKVPDRMTVQLELRYDGQTIPQGLRRVAIKKEAFKTTFGPYPQKLLYGNYSVELLFELGSQSKRKRRKWEQDLTDTQKEIYGRLQRRDFTQYGTGPGGKVTAEDRARQDAEKRTHYLAFCNQVQKLRDKVYAGVADAGRSFFRKGREVQEADYKAWLKKMGFANTDAECDPIIAKARLSKKTGHFQHKLYQQWAENQVASELEALYKKHRRFNDQYLSPIDEKADTMGDWLLSIILIRFQEWSAALYEHEKISVPSSIGELPVTPVKAPQLSTKFFDAKRRELMRRVGLGDQVDKETK